MVSGRHVARDVSHRVAVWPHDQPTVLVIGQGRGDLLPTADDPAREEVPHRAGLRRGERLRTAIGDGLRVRARAATATPAIAVVAIEIGALGGRPRIRLAVLAPVVVLAPGDVVFGAVRVHEEHDPDLARIDDLRDPGVRSVTVGQPAQDPQRHLDAHVLVGVVAPIDHDFRLTLVGRHVVRDLGGPELPSEIALADGEPPDDVGVRGLGGSDLGRDLGMGVVARIARRELVRRKGRGRGEERGDEQTDGQGGRRDLGERAGCHASMVTGRGKPDHMTVGPDATVPDVRC